MSISREQVEAYLAETEWGCFENPNTSEKGIIKRGHDALSTFRPLGETWAVVLAALLEGDESPRAGPYRDDLIKSDRRCLQKVRRRAVFRRNRMSRLTRKILEALTRLEVLKEPDLEELTERVVREMEEGR